MLILSPMKHARQGHRQQNYEYNLKHMMTKSPKGSSPYTWDTCKRQTPCITTDNNMNHSKQEKSGKREASRRKSSKITLFFTPSLKTKGRQCIQEMLHFLFIRKLHTWHTQWVLNLQPHPPPILVEGWSAFWAKVHWCTKDIILSPRN